MPEGARRPSTELDDTRWLSGLSRTVATSGFENCALTTQPIGGAGGRIGCGVIQAGGA